MLLITLGRTSLGGGGVPGNVEIKYNVNVFLMMNNKQHLIQSKRNPRDVAAVVGGFFFFSPVLITVRDQLDVCVCVSVMSKL